MILYEYRCPACGREFSVKRLMGEAGPTEPCPDCGEPASRVFSVATLIMTYPMSLAEAEEQVHRMKEEDARTYERPPHEVIMERARAMIADRERSDGQRRWQGGEI